MKCLQCGTDLDRLSKMRGSSEYCSEECKQKGDNEFNLLAMSRLMQTRLTKAPAQTGSAAVRTVESGNIRLTMVTHPVGASSPLVTEPPEAGFIMEASATLAVLQLRQQSAMNPRPQSPMIPDSPLPLVGDLEGLESLVNGGRPKLRKSRPYSPLGRASMAWPLRVLPDPVLPDCDLVWPPLLGLEFSVLGIEDSPSEDRAATAPIAASVEAVEESAPNPVVHQVIPILRPARELPRYTEFETGSNRLVGLPAINPPRLRIHLPKPTLHTLRPRFAFAPRSAGDIAAGNVVPKSTSPASVQPVSAQAAAAAPSEPAPIPVVIHEPLNKKSGQKSGAKRTQQSAAALQKLAASALDRPVAPKPESLWTRIPVWQKAGAASLLLVAIAVGVWALRREPSRPTPPRAVSAVTGSWETNPAGDTNGVARKRMIRHYKPAIAKRDYVFEFTGQVEKRALAWVVRWKDARDYYCMKLEQLGDNPSTGFQLVKFAVINGVEQARQVASLPGRLPAGKPIRIRLEARGPSFTTQINGKQVDVWVDRQLAEGAVGFSNESGESAAVSDVKVTF